MTDELTVAVEGIALRGRCGVTAEERAAGQTLVVDVRLAPRETRAMSTDGLADTVDYGRLVDLVRGCRRPRVQPARAPSAAILDRVWESFRAHPSRSPWPFAPPVSVPVARRGSRWRAAPEARRGRERRAGDATGTHGTRPRTAANGDVGGARSSRSGPTSATARGISRRRVPPCQPCLARACSPPRASTRPRRRSSPTSRRFSTRSSASRPVWRRATSCAPVRRSNWPAAGRGSAGLARARSMSIYCSSRASSRTTRS